MPPEVPYDPPDKKQSTMTLAQLGWKPPAPPRRWPTAMTIGSVLAVLIGLGSLLYGLYW